MTAPVFEGYGLSDGADESLALVTGGGERVEFPVAFVHPASN